jgi:tetratricopeptide (TPR) repeat protein
LRLNPNNMFAYYSLSFAFLRASRFAEAKAICEQSIRAKRDSADIHGLLLTITLVEGDGPAFQRQLDWFQVNQELDPSFLDQQASIAFTLGQVRKGRRLFERSRAASVRLQSSNSALGGKDYAAFSTGNEAQLEEEIGNLREARAKAEYALRLMPESTEAQVSAAVVFASLGDFRSAEQLGRKLSERFPSDTLLIAIALPSIRAAAEIRKKNPGAAIEELRPSTPYDLGSRQDLPDGIVPYHRGLAYLALGSGEQAAAQFQKLLENRGMVAVSPYWPLAHLGLARAYALEARTAQGVDADTARTRARDAYQDFFALWKDADPDIPILKHAKVEYARLQ